MEKIVAQIKTILEMEPKFIGFKAMHRYRAKNNAGQVLMGNARFLFNEELTDVVSMFDMDGEEYQAV